MKMLITAMSFLVFNAVAAEHLDDMKRAALDKIGRDMNSLEANKTCVNGAKTVTEFNNCKVDVGSMTMQKEETKSIEKKVDKMKVDEKMMEDKAMKNKEMMDQSY